MLRWQKVKAKRIQVFHIEQKTESYQRRKGSPIHSQTKLEFILLQMPTNILEVLE